MSMSTPPVGGPPPASDNGNVDNAEQTSDAKEGEPTAAPEASGTVGGLPKRSPLASGAQHAHTRQFNSTAPSLEPTSTAVPREDRPPLSRPAPRDLRAAFGRKPPESPADEATTPNPTET